MYWDAMLAQVRFGYNVTRVSPCVVYQRAVEAIAGSGIDHYASFLEQAREYRLALRQFFLDHYPLNINRPHAGARSMNIAEKNDRELVEGLSSRTFTAAEIPKFYDDPISMEDAMRNSLWNTAILLMFNVVFFMAACISFLNRDVR